MKPLLALATAALLLAGCDQVTTMADQSGRDAAKQAARPVVARLFPGVPTEPVTDCVIERATQSELFELARAATLGETTETTRVVIDVARRPDTLRCIARKNIALHSVAGGLA